MPITFVNHKAFLRGVLLNMPTVAVSETFYWWSYKEVGDMAYKV